MKQAIKIMGCLIITLFSIQTFAEDTISITVKTNEKLVAGIGYTVGGKELGGAGKSYVGQGPKNKKYSFGFRKRSVKGLDVSCGSATLSKNSNVLLVMKGNQCHSVVN